MAWEKGKSGNPNGRTARRLISTHIERELLQQATDAEAGKDVTKARRIAEKVVELAVAGNPWAIQFVTERTEGRPDQHVSISSSVRELSDSDLTDIASGSSDRAPEPAPSAEVPSKLH